MKTNKYSSDNKSIRKQMLLYDTTLNLPVKRCGNKKIVYLHSLSQKIHFHKCIYYKKIIKDVTNVYLRKSQPEL
jgi:hypothetical protein